MTDGLFKCIERQVKERSLLLVQCNSTPSVTFYPEKRCASLTNPCFIAQRDAVKRNIRYRQHRVDIYGVEFYGYRRKKMESVTELKSRMRLCAFQIMLISVKKA